MTDTGWLCLDRLETAFKVVRMPRADFSQAVDACAVDGGNLASIRDLQDWAGIISVGSNLGAFQEDFWIGVRATFNFDDDSQAAIPSNYEFLDGTEDIFFNVPKGNFPWNRTNPVHNRNHQCITMNPTTVTNKLGQLRWKNEPCNKNLGYVCRRLCAASLSNSTNSSWAPALGIFISLLMVAVLLFGWKEMKDRKKILKELQETLVEHERATNYPLVKSSPTPKVASSLAGSD